MTFRQTKLREDFSPVGLEFLDAAQGSTDDIEVGLGEVVGGAIGGSGSSLGRHCGEVEGG